MPTDGNYNRFGTRHYKPHLKKRRHRIPSVNAFDGFSLQAGFENTVPDASETLRGLKESSPIPFQLIPDSLGADRLPAYIVGARQVTDGHLLELAQESSMHLATLDRGIPGAWVIPEGRAGG